MKHIGQLPYRCPMFSEAAVQAARLSQRPQAAARCEERFSSIVDASELSFAMAESLENLGET